MVTWSKPARNDLKQIHDHISIDSKYYAKVVTRTIAEKADNLAEFPFFGRVVPEIDDPNVREIFVYSYRLIYEVKEGGVQVLAVVHGKRDFFAQITAQSDVQQ
jgi:toxin ParE1/3/4